MVSKNILMGRVSWLSELVIHAELKFKQGGDGVLEKTSKCFEPKCSVFFLLHMQFQFQEGTIIYASQDNK